MILMTIMLASFVHIQDYPVQEIVYEGSNFYKTVCQKLTPNGTALDQCKYKVIALDGNSMQITGWKKAKACIKYAKENGEIPDINQLRFVVGEIDFDTLLERWMPRPAVYGNTSSRNDYDEFSCRTSYNVNDTLPSYPSERDIDWMVRDYKYTLRYRDDKNRIGSSTPYPLYTGCERIDMFMDDMRNATIERECERLERQRIYSELDL